MRVVELNDDQFAAMTAALAEVQVAMKPLSAEQRVRILGTLAFLYGVHDELRDRITTTAAEAGL